jgi:hypothetical protein
MRIGRLCLIILALTTATLSAAPRKGGSAVRSKAVKTANAAAAGSYWYYCYSDPGTIYPCDGDACDCRAECASVCGGYCDWDNTCIN